MTLVRMGLRAPIELTAGRMEWRPRRHVNGADVVLPAVVRLVLVEGVATVADLAPGVWTAEEFVSDVGETRTVLVPETSETLNYAELVDVDPDTVDPIGPAPVDVWEERLREATAEASGEASGYALAADGASQSAIAQAAAAGQHRQASETAAGQAAGAATTAGTARGQALDSANDADASARAAAGSATAADTSAGAAAGSAATAGLRAGAADGSAQAASSSALAAGNSANAAGNSAADAVTARTGAETARNEANTALTNTRAARDETYVTVASATLGAGTTNLPASITRSKYLVRTLTGNAVLTMNSGTSGVAYTCTIEVRQDATGGRTLAFAGTNIRLPYGLQPEVTAAPNAIDIVQLLWTGTVWVVLQGAQDLRALP